MARNEQPTQTTGHLMWEPEDTQLTILWLTTTLITIASALTIHTMITTLIN